MFVEKQHQLDYLKRYNNRLRAIETEFKSACKGNVQVLYVN